MMEVKLIRAFDRIEQMKRMNKWSFRQPKKQRIAAGLTKTHWDYLMDEMVSIHRLLSGDMRHFTELLV